jgi:hypothetical protein
MVFPPCPLCRKLVMHFNSVLPTYLYRGSESSTVVLKGAALLDDRRTAPRDIYDLELLLARGICPSSAAVDNLGGRSALLKRVADKLDLMGWNLFRDEVLPTLPDELNAHIDEDEYLAMKLRLLDTLERCTVKPVGEPGPT